MLESQSGMDAALAAKEARLKELLAGSGRSLLAYSGGVDSALLAVVCREVLGDDFLAVLADSPSLPRWEKEEALSFASEQGFAVRVVNTREMERADYRRNADDRCFHCKSELFALMEELAGSDGFANLLYGGNLSDRGDHRPGKDAARKFEVRAPLDEAELSKDEIRRLARARGLSIWDKPARACLASRIPHHEEVTPRKLAQVEGAEGLLKELGFRNYRVRHHGAIARIELGAEEWERLQAPELRERIAAGIREQGFAAVCLDLEPFASGRLSRMSRHGNLTEDSRLA